MNEPVESRRPRGAVSLSEALDSLRDELATSILSAGRPYHFGGEEYLLQFIPGPIELSLEVAATTGGTVEAGIKWWLVTATTEASTERQSTQTLKLTLEPILTDVSTGERQEFRIDGEV